MSSYLSMRQLCSRQSLRRMLKQSLTVGFFLATSAIAQVAPNHIPNAPTPNPVLSRTVSDNTVVSNSRDSSSVIADPSASAVSLYTVVDLALRNSKAVHLAEAERERVRSLMLESRDVYIPNLQLGSGLGYSYGFPIGTPTLFSVNSTGLLFSFSQRSYIRSTRAALNAATLSLKNVRQQVILDTTLDYIELDKTLEQLAALNQAVVDTDGMISVIEDRVHAGLESKITVTRAELTRAQIQLRSIQMQDHAEELKKHLAGLTGLDPAAISPAPSSIPQLPDLDFHSIPARTTQTPLVEAAFATADSKMYQYFGDKRQNYRPTVSFVFQYARFATFNNYQQYYGKTTDGKNNFQFDNVGVGIQAVWPLFDPLRRDKAMESKAEADRARQQAELTQIQNNEANLALWHGLRELEAQEQVAQLQQQLAAEMLNSIVIQMNSGSATSNAPPVTPQQAAQTRIEERTSYADMRDAEFNVTRSKLNLLNAVGELEDWAKQTGQQTLDTPTHSFR